MLLVIERGNTRSHNVESAFWKMLWTCLKTDDAMNDTTWNVYLTAYFRQLDVLERDFE